MVCKLCDFELWFAREKPLTAALINSSKINYHSLRQTRLCQPLLSEPISSVKTFACLIITVFMSAVIVSTQEGLSEIEEIGFLCHINSLIFLFFCLLFPLLKLLYRSVSAWFFSISLHSPPFPLSHLCPFIFFHPQSNHLHWFHKWSVSLFMLMKIIPQ